MSAAGGTAGESGAAGAGRHALRPMLPGEAELLAILMQAAILEGAGASFDDDQRDAWAASAEDHGFALALARGLTLVVEEEGEPVGFAVLGPGQPRGGEGGGEAAEGRGGVPTPVLTHVYVHPDRMADGIGRALVDALMRLARARGAARVGVVAPDGTEGFFEALGFTRLDRRTLAFSGEWLGATGMERRLDGDGAP